MTDFSAIFPELLLTAIACILFLLGCSKSVWARKIAPLIALLALAAALAIEVFHPAQSIADASIFHGSIASFIRALSLGIAIMLLLLSWPSDAAASGNSALAFGMDASGEYYALFLLSIAGLLLTTVANDLIILFLALELTSIPTYVMVSISRPRAAAQEAGVKYFFLGALSIAIMLFGFSYLYGTTGQIRFGQIAAVLQSHAHLSRWELLAIVLCIIGFAYKMAAFPLHFYAGDVYEGAATPVTAFLAFVPKTAGFVAMIKLLAMVGGDQFAQLPQSVLTLLWVVAALTMSFGNVLGLLQSNVKRVLAYSSIAHSGYMLVGLASLRGAPQEALRGVLFYLAAYGMMNAAAFGILMLLPARPRLGESNTGTGETAAETFDDLAGQGRNHLALGLAMAVACFSLIGIPLTIGFIGKVFLIRPALAAHNVWLTIILVINAAVSAAYYLRIVGTMFLRPEPAGEAAAPPTPLPAQPAVIAGVALSILGTLVFGILPMATERLVDHAAANASGIVPSPITATASAQ